MSCFSWVSRHLSACVTRPSEDEDVVEHTDTAAASGLHTSDAGRSLPDNDEYDSSAIGVSEFLSSREASMSRCRGADAEDVTRLSSRMLPTPSPAIPDNIIVYESSVGSATRKTTSRGASLSLEDKVHLSPSRPSDAVHPALKQVRSMGL